MDILYKIGQIEGVILSVCIISVFPSTVNIQIYIAKKYIPSMYASIVCIIIMF